MRLPKQVRVLSQDYAVVYDPALTDIQLAGEANYHEKRIRINPELKGFGDFEVAQTLWHEIIHAYSEESGLNQLLDRQAREMVCETLSRLIVNLTGGKIRCKS